ncbi:Os07g0463800, partial [Oryza sativa Japonica Group]
CNAISNSGYNEIDTPPQRRSKVAQDADEEEAVGVLQRRRGGVVAVGPAHLQRRLLGSRPGPLLHPEAVGRLLRQRHLQQVSPTDLPVRRRGGSCAAACKDCQPVESSSSSSSEPPRYIGAPPPTGCEPPPTRCRRRRRNRTGAASHLPTPEGAGIDRARHWPRVVTPARSGGATGTGDAIAGAARSPTAAPPMPQRAPPPRRRRDITVPPPRPRRPAAIVATPAPGRDGAKRDGPAAAIPARRPELPATSSGGGEARRREGEGRRWLGFRPRAAARGRREGTREFFFNMLHIMKLHFFNSIINKII